MNIDTVILSLTNSDMLYNMTKACIQSLHQSESTHKFNVTVVESNSAFASTEYNYENCTTLVPQVPFNYHRYCKIGLAQGSSDWVMLCNNDLVFHAGWFTTLLQAAEKYPSVRSFGVWNSFENWHTTRFPEVQDVYVGNGIGYELTGWCIVAKREIFATVNLCERVAFWFSDNIYRDQLIEHDIPHMLVRNSVVDHITSKTLFTLPHHTIVDLTDAQMQRYYS